MSRIHAGLAAALVVLAACDATGPGSGARVSIRFATVAAPAAANLGVSSAGEFILEGANGTLVLTDVHFIVDEFEMERQEGACEAQSGLTSAAAGNDDEREHDEDDECEEFSAGPFFVGLDLAGDVPVVVQEVPAGVYTRLKFEVEDTELDEEDDDDSAAGLQALLQDIHDAGFTDWPSEASMVVSGTFTPAGGTPRPFTVYLEAELKIRKWFDPPLDVAGDGSTITVEVDPSLWFRGANGGVLDLSVWDFTTTHRVIEFEAKLEDGFRKLRCDDD